MTYKPHTFQQQFHKSNVRFRTLIAGRRGGKSLAGTVEALWWAQTYPGTLGYVVSPTYGMLKDVNVPMIFEWVPHTSVDSYNKVENRLVLTNGSEIRFRSGDKEDSLRGPGIDWLWLDEACFMNPYAWDVLYPALTDKNGVAWVTTTPQGYDWVYNKFYKPARDGDPDYAAWTYKTIDNPYIDPEMIAKAKQDMSEQMFRQEYLATFEKFSGLVYPDFSEKKHTFDKLPDDIEAPLYFVGIDVGYTNPTAALLVMEDEKHGLWVLDEYYESNKTAPEIVEGIRAMVGDKKIENYIIDPASRGTQQTSEMSVFDQVLEAGLPVIPGDNDVRGGINRVTQLFRNDGLMIHKKCENLIRELNVYSWKEGKRDESNKDERPMKKDDHACFVAGTQVMTDRGQVAIENVRLGDMVMTPGGYKPVCAQGLTGYESVYRVEISGVVLEGTGNHPILTDRGLIRLDTLRYGDIIYSWTEGDLRVLNTTGMVGTSPQQVAVSMAGSDFMLRYGNRTMEKSQRVMPFTISTGTRETTTQQTYSLSVRACTVDTTVPREQATQSTETGCSSTWTGSGHSQRLGTHQTRVGSGMSNMQRGYLEIGSRGSSPVESAASSLPQGGISQSFAPITASRSGGENRGSMMLTEGAFSATRSSGSTATLGYPIVVRSVPQRLPFKREVYNLSVAEIPYYYANGVLVHNCDSLRYTAMHRPDWYVRRERDRYGVEIPYVGEGDFFSEGGKYDIM